MLVSLLIAIMRIPAGSSWLCGGDLTLQPIPSINQESALERGSTLSPIRILFFPISFDLGDPNSNSEFSGTILPSVLNFFSNSLKVYPVIQNIIVPGISCLPNIIVPEEHQTIGVSGADIIVYVSSKNDSNDNNVGYAGACLLDHGKNNVVVGSVILNIFHYSKLDLSSKYSVLMHELMHVLGFSSKLFEYWKDDQGLEYPIDGIYKSQVIRGSQKFVIVTPNVLEKARINFACEHLQGLELEDFPSSSAPSSHWDKRILDSEFMNSLVSSDPVYSSISLALLKDTGWYEVSYELGQVHSKGRQLDCQLFDEPCIQNGKSQDDELWCYDPNDVKCDFFHLNKAFCNIENYESPLPEQFRYFDDPIIGGDPYSDYCPARLPYSNGSCRGNGERTQTMDLTDEVISDQSRCFESNLMAFPYKLEIPYTACYQVRECTDLGAYVQIGSETLLCPFTGGEFSVSGYTGKIKCPASRILCEEIPCLNGCLGSGICYQGKCHCNPGRSGSDCSIQCPENCDKCTQSTCTTCLANFILQSGLCIQSKCQTNCQSCSDSTCSKCFDGFYLSDKICHSCPNGCSACDSASACSSCSLKFQLQDSTCTPICPFHCTSCNDPEKCTDCELGFYLKSNSCFSCDLGCKACDQIMCWECLQGYKFVDFICQPSCPDHCLDCNNNHCDACIIGYSLNYLTPNECTKCPDGCKACRENFICVECFDGFKLFGIFDGLGNFVQICKKIECANFCSYCVDSTCLECLDGFLLVDGECLSCSNNCGLCGPDTICEDCSPGFVMVGSQCVPCPEGCFMCVPDGICVVCLGNYVNVDGVCAPICFEHCLSCGSDFQCTTCEDGYFINTEKNCQICSEHCTKCQSFESCSECAAEFALIENSCRYLCLDQCTACDLEGCTNCQEGYFLQNQRCITCNAGCRTCEDQSKCLDCLESHYKSDPICKPCPETCLQCESELNCIECVEGQWSQQGICTDNCGQGCLNCLFSSCLQCLTHFVLVDNHCEYCGSDCLTCDNEKNCLSCITGYILENNQCLKDCGSNCKDCELGQCLVCNNGFFLFEGKCEQCHNNCEVCYNASVCIKCFDGFYVHSNSDCLACPATCTTCFNDFICSNCVTGYVLSNHACVPDCPSNCLICTSHEVCTHCNDRYYIYDQLCKPCPDNCLSCVSANQCTECDQGFILSNKKCSLCKDSCKLCDSLGCVSCNKGFYLRNHDCVQCNLGCKSCVDEWGCTECLTSHFISGVGCSPCPGGCLECDSLTWCSSCEENYVLNSGKCLVFCADCQLCSSSGICLQCNSGYFITSNGKCESCSKNCSKCSSCNWCTNCMNGYLLVNGKCVYHCQTSCKKCSEDKCNECKAGYYLSNEFCVNCSIGCISCNAEICFTCAEGYFIQGTGCHPCPASCSKCDSLNWCSACQAEFSLTQGKCN